MYYYEHFFVFEADIFHVTIYCSQITIIKLLVHMITYTKYGLRGLFPIDVINPNLVKVISHLKDTNQRCHIMCLLYIYLTMILLYGIIARSNVNLYWWWHYSDYTTNVTCYFYSMIILYTYIYIYIYIWYMQTQRSKFILCLYEYAL